MGNTTSAQRKKDISDEIDRQIEQESNKFRRECKVLLLGSSEGGGSTIVKHMKINDHNGYSLDELAEFKHAVYRDLVDSAQNIVTAMMKLGLKPLDPANRFGSFTDTILNYQLSPKPEFTLDPEIIQAIQSLWQDPIIPSLMERSSEFYLMDTAPYFFQEVQRIGSPAYLPNEADVLRCSSRRGWNTITETRFNTGQLSICVLDVSGLRSERKKWIHYFESVTSLIFCAALSEYNEVLLGDTSQNLLAESFVLFESVINSRWFLRTSIILFLTKIDVFKHKLPKDPLERYFPEYTGGADINKAAKYIL